jgi:hypothetical protein
MSLDDPTDIEGVLPVEITPGPLRKDTTRSNAATGASAAGVRAFTAQAVAFYFRAPVKAFFRTRVDYLVRMRALVYEDYHLLEMQAYAKPTSPIWQVLMAYYDSRSVSTCGENIWLALHS